MQTARYVSPVIPMALFAGATVVSYLYCATTGQFNGDFYPRETTLSAWLLFFALLVALMPYAIGWWLHRLVSRVPAARPAKVSRRFLHTLMIGTMSWHMLMTLSFQVGVMNQEVYDAPGLIKPFIQIGNRIDPFCVGVFYILATPKRYRLDMLAALSMISLGLMRAGLGAFVYILIALAIKYRVEWLGLLRRRLALVVAIAIAVPFLASTLYDLRSSLRGEAELALAVTDLVLAKLAGRLSSFSNLAYLIQETDNFAVAARDLSSGYYVQQILGSLVSSSFVPDLTPEKLLIDVNLIYDGFSTYMAGVPGNLLLAYYRSPVVAVLNAAITLGMMLGTLLLSRRFANGAASSFGICMLLYPLTSGVAYEFASLLLNTAFILVLCLLNPARRRKQRLGTSHSGATALPTDALRAQS
jgi:hypothetical protein